MNSFIHALETDDATRERLLNIHAEIEKALEQGKTLTPTLLSTLKSAMEDALVKQPQLGAFLEKARQSQNEHYHIHLTCDDKDILNLPWQLTVNDLSYCYLTKSHALGNGLPVHTAQAHPLKILVMIAAPEGAHAGARLDYEEEESRILQAFEPLFKLGQVEIDFTDDGSLQNLEEKLRQNHYHILHFSGHGIYDEETKAGYLQLEQPDTFEPELIPATEFARIVNVVEGRPPSLIFLSSCQTAQGEAEKGMRGVADELMAVRVPAVIAMSFSILDFFATQFAAHLYGNIAAKKHLLESFQKAIDFIKYAEFEYLQQTGQAAEPGQWLIPQLYCSKDIQHLVNWEGAGQKLHIPKQIIPGAEGRIMLAHDKEYRFIGRRRELRKTFPLLKQNQPVLLTGMGGVGKTALAEHLLKRLMAANANCLPFIFDETSLSAERVLQEMIKYLKYKVKDIVFLRQYNLTDTKILADAVEENANKNPNQQEEDFLLLLSRFQEKDITPVFVFDNLESFQSDPGEAFKPEHQSIITFIQALINSGTEHLILTSRYPLKEFPDLFECNINQVHLNDFTKKYLQLSLREWSENKGLGLLETVKLLHKLLGGHYRTLEFLDTLYKEDKLSFNAAMDNLEQLEEKLRQELPHLTGKLMTQQLEERSKGLVFEELIKLLQPLELKALQILSHYRRPELLQAVQVHDEQVTLEHLYRLQRLTLIERTIDNNANWEYFYVAPLTRNWLHTQSLAQYHFDHNITGEYFLYVDKEVNLRNYDDLEEAFYHFYEAKNIDKVHDIGEDLSYFFDQNNQFYKALSYGLKTEEAIGMPTHPVLLNRIALILLLFGDRELALSYLQRCKIKYEEVDNKKGVATSINNISSIYQAKGDYNQALQFLLDSKKIHEEIGDKEGLGAALNNISQIHRSRGEYDRALDFLLDSKKIYEEIDDKKGLAATLNNIGQIYKAKGDYNQALQFLLDSKKIYEKIGNKKGLGTTLNNIGQIYEAKGDHDQALQFILNSKRIREEIGDKQGLGTTLNNISQIYEAKGDYNQALQFLFDSKKIREEIGDKRGLSITLNNISNIYNVMGDYEEELKLRLQDKVICEEIGDRPGLGTTLYNIAFNYLQQKNIDQFFEYMQQSYSLFAETGNAEGLYHAGRELGEFLCVNKHLEQGLALLQHSEQIGLQAGFPDTNRITEMIAHFTNLQNDQSDGTAQ